MKPFAFRIRMTVGIYCIENMLDGKKYIGKSIDIRRRFREHNNMLTNPVRSHRNRHLQYAVNKYGISVFKFYVLEELPLDEDILRERETYWMDFYRTYESDFGYNLIRDSSSGTIVSEETRKIHSLRTTGENNPMFGKTHTDTAKKRISENRKGSNHSKETRDKMAKDRAGEGNSMFGRAHSENTRRLITDKISKYCFEQYTTDGKFVRLWNSKAELENAGFHSGHVYSVCNGNAATHKGFVWKKIQK